MANENDSDDKKFVSNTKLASDLFEIIQKFEKTGANEKRKRTLEAKAKKYS